MTPSAPSADLTAFGELKSALVSARETTASELLAAHPAPSGSLGYDPSQAVGLELITSTLSLGEGELERLGESGLVISRSQRFPSFAYGYQTLYMNDVPLFISADSLLEAVHRSYDDLLTAFERGVVIAELGQLLDSLRSALPSLEADAEVRADLDLYLAVAKSLLDGRAAAPVAGADAEVIASFVANAQAANGLVGRELFGVPRQVDFSQFEPRGHYNDSPDLQQYFRAMIWLGRIDFRLLETQSDGSQVFHRRQYEAVRSLGELFGTGDLARFERIDRIVRAFVGEPDYMMPPDIAQLVQDLGGQQAAREASDEAVSQAIVDGGYGAQRIASHFIVNDVSETLPLNRSFALFGQRYVLDSHVFSNVTWARTAAQRMMPDPLDVAFAALGNDAAAQVLAPELERYDYAGNLAGVRLLADSHDPDYWTSNLYNAWLGSLRALSPTPSAEAPELTRTEPWAMRVLNTQLASWAQLRHDTILYVKQSYTDGASCEFPDAYVDPYPEFYAALRAYAEIGVGLADLAEGSSATHWNGTESVPLDRAIREHFQQVADVATILGEMAVQQLDGTPFTDAQMEFINRVVSVRSEGCGGPPFVTEGWYGDLYFDRGAAAEFDPTIADVHTQPTEPGGALVGKVLHAGTGWTRLMVVTAETCEGPKAYAGLASSYHEVVTEDFERLTDDQWAERFNDGATPADEPWLESVLAD